MTLDSANLSAPFANLTSTSHSNQSALLSMTDANKLSLTRTNPVLQSEFRWTRSFLVSWQFVILLFLKSDSSTFLSNSLWCCNAAAAAGSEKDQTQHVAATTAEEQDLIFFFRKKKEKKKKTDHFDVAVCGMCVSKRVAEPFVPHRIRSAALPLPEAEVGGMNSLIISNYFFFLMQL